MYLTKEQRREVAEMVMTLGANRRGIITSYQSAPPMVKAQIMPALADPPAETGWIPYKSWATGLEGAGWSVVAPPQAGQQVMLLNEEADGQNFTAWGGYYSDVDTAPQGASPGEILMQHQSGSQLHLKADGSITMLTSTLNIAAPDGGNVTVNVTGSVNASGDVTAAGVSLKGHEHTSESPGTPTSPPISTDMGPIS